MAALFLSKSWSQKSSKNSESGLYCLKNTNRSGLVSLFLKTFHEKVVYLSPLAGALATFLYHGVLLIMIRTEYFCTFCSRFYFKSFQGVFHTFSSAITSISFFSFLLFHLSFSFSCPVPIIISNLHCNMTASFVLVIDGATLKASLHPLKLLLKSILQWVEKVAVSATKWIIKK